MTAEGESKKTGIRTEVESVEELRGVLEALSDFFREIPQMLREVLEILYDKELAKKAAESFAAFYKTLVEQGISETTALTMAKKYYEDNMSIKSIIEAFVETRKITGSKKKKREEEREED